MTQRRSRQEAARSAVGKNSLKNNTGCRPIFYKSSEVVYTLRRMYGLIVPLKNKNHLPWGYDSYITHETGRWAIPNDEAFQLLVQGKHLLKETSFRKLGSWLGQALININYNFEYVHNYNPSKGLSEQSINRIYKYYRPEDVCMLELHERERCYEAELQRQGVTGAILKRD